MPQAGTRAYWKICRIDNAFYRTAIFCQAKSFYKHSTALLEPPQTEKKDREYIFPDLV
jgi:hypothetical protein